MRTCWGSDLILYVRTVTLLYCTHLRLLNVLTNYIWNYNILDNHTYHELSDNYGFNWRSRPWLKPSIEFAKIRKSVLDYFYTVTKMDLHKTGFLMLLLYGFSFNGDVIEILTKWVVTKWLFSNQPLRVETVALNSYFKPIRISRNAKYSILDQFKECYLTNTSTFGLLRSQVITCDDWQTQGIF
jgi:hypothetical protein